MTLTINGKKVLGYALGDNEFVPYSNTLFDFSKAVLDTKIYFSSQTLIGETNTDNGHFVVSFYYASNLASTNDGFNDCRIVGATYISENNVGTTPLNAGAGMYYIFSVYVYDSGMHYPEGNFFIRADQVVPKPSGSSDRSMIY